MTSTKSSIVFFIFLLTIFGGCGRAEDRSEDYRVKEYEGRIALSQEQKMFLLAAVREGLRYGAVPEADPALAAIGGAGASLEMFVPPLQPIIKIAGGDNFYRAFTEAVGQLAAETASRPGYLESLEEAQIKIGIIDRVFDLRTNNQSREKVNLRRFGLKLDDGLNGFILVHNGKAVYQHPDLALYRGWGLDLEKSDEREKRQMGRNLLRRQLQELAIEATGDPQAWQTGKLYAFTMQSFIDSYDQPGLPVDCYRGNIPIPPLDAKSLLASLRSNLDYLSGIIGEDGKLNYVYYPIENQYDPDYHIVRHTGYALRLIQAYNKFGEERYLELARKALGYVLARTIIPDQAPGITLVQYDDQSLLGANALMAMIYSVMPENLLTAKEKNLRDRFGKAILYYRMPEAGHFYTTFKQTQAKEKPEEQALYFPGIAMLALVRLYERTGDKKWWDAAVQISIGQKNLWQQDGDKAVGKYCWVGQAWARMTRLEKDPDRREEYRELGYSHCDAVIEHQWTPDRPGYYPDYLGAADNSRPPRTTPTSARAESLAENYLTAKFLGDIASQKKYGVALLQALHFVTQNQFSRHNSWFLPKPKKAYGGIRGGLLASDIRIDYNQHALAAQLNALEVPADLAALGVTDW